MNRKRKRCWGLAIAASAVMVLSALPAFAAPAEDSQVYTISEDFSDVTPEMSDVDAAVAGVSETEEVDTSDPELAAVAAELDDIEVTAEDGTTTGLTDEQKTTVLNLFSQYQQNWTDNADTLGVQMPFYLQYNDSEEDGLGVLGEMLVLAGYTVDDVRNGNYSYDDLTGMIMNFYYGDKLGVEYYGSDIKSDRDEALQAVEDSGATTDYQKLLVLNDYLASIDSFDMSYIMNSGKDTPVMVAEDEQKHEHYDDVYNVLYEAYEPQIEENFRSQIKEEVTTQFHDQIFAGIETDLRQQYYESAIKNIVYQQALESAADPENPTDEEKAAAEETATNYMTENADAISEDAAGFVETNFGSDAATQLSTGADEFIASAETDGVEVSEGVTMTVEELTQQQLADDETLNVDMDGDGTNDTTFPDAIDQYTEAAMTSTDPAVDLDGDGTNETSIPDAITTYTTQAATQLTTGVLNYWEGSHIGAFGEGKSVCLGYAKAFAYLVQCMNSEYYCGSADGYKTASNWKTASELYYDSDGNLSIDTGYMVDLVRISFAADVTMYGETQEDFNSDHFWNAVKVNGTWYYIDPCYTDVYTEVMIRDRVETAGYINHMYFMFSHTTTTSLYDGYYSEIKSLYSEAATDQTYENAWFARAKSNVYSDGSAFYYIYDSTDTIGMMDEYNSSGFSTGTSTASEVDSNQASSSTSSMFSSLSEAARYKLVMHTITDDDSGSSVTTDDDTEVGDVDYTTLIEFNYSEDDDDEVGVARVYNPGTGEMEENELLTKLYAQHAEQAEIYPSIAITTVLYDDDGKLYFNLSNTILSYNPDDGAIEVVKQYGTVYGTRDKTNAFGGMAFSLSEDSGDIELSNHPIAGLYLDGTTLTVSIATNLSYISGKEGDNGANRSTETDYTADSETNGYGYVYEETNYNPSYNSYTTNSSMYSTYGVDEEINDNDEFMWVSNFVGTTDITGLSAVEYDSVDDLLINCDHHYIKFDETYFTKDDNGNWNTGFCYVCTQCGKAVEEPTDNSNNDYLSDEEKEEAEKEYEEELAEYNAAAESAGHTYSPVDGDAEWSAEAEDGTRTVTFQNLKVSCICPDVKELLDCLYYASWNETVTLDEAITATAKKSESGDCYKDGITYTWTAEGKTAEENGVNYLATMSESGGDAGTQHVYTGEFTWTETEDGGYSATVGTLTCSVCGATAEGGDCDEIFEAVAATCTTAGGTLYTATFTVTDADSDTIGTATGTKMVDDEAQPALTHDLVGEFTWTEEIDESGHVIGYTGATATVTCQRDGCGLTRENVEAEVTSASDDATCTEAGTVTYKATVTVYEQDEDGKDTETEAGTVTDTKEVTGVALGHDYEGEWTWSGKDAVLTMTCSRCGDVQTPNVTVVKTASTDPTCTGEGSETYQATATFDYDGETYNDEEEIAIDALGHDYAEEEWGSWASDASSVSFALGCSRCDSVVNPEVTIEGEGTATCTGAGTRTFTATAEYDGKTYTDPETKSLTVAALGHTDANDDGECTRCHEILMLDAPALTGVSDVNGGVKVKWSAVSGAAQYRVYVKKDGKWKKAGDTTGKSFTYTGVKSGTKYEFTVACLSKSGKNVVSSYDTTGKSVVYLTAGKVTSVTNASGGVTVKWKKVTGASGYYIYRKTGSGSYSKIATIKSGSTVKYTDKKVKSKNGKTYTYAVKAYSGKSVGAKVTTKKIVRLTGVSLKSLTNVKGKKLTVKWKKNSKATGYQIAYSTSSSFASSKTKTVKVSKAKTVSKKLTKLSKKKYYVRIRVYRKVSGTTYYSAWSSKKSVKIKK